VKARDAHPELLRQAVDPQRLVEFPAEPLDGVRDSVGLAAQERHVAKPVSLVSHLLLKPARRIAHVSVAIFVFSFKEIPCSFARIPRYNNSGDKMLLIASLAMRIPGVKGRSHV
jgi:hypothetical protein